MTFGDYFVNLVLSGILIVGAYQFYFFTQRHPLRKPIVWRSPIDEAIPFKPQWSWVYSFLYYPAILYLNLLAEDSGHFNKMAFSFLVLLFMQMIFFWLFPVSTPEHWRSINTGKTWSEKFLLFVQKFDQSTNCFPSMHVSVAMLTALHAWSGLGAWGLLFPLLIALSCVYTKQHYLVDLPAGALLGCLAYVVYGWVA